MASDRGTPAFVARRMQHHKFECTTKMYFNPEDENETAGILLYKDEFHQYFLAVSKSGDQRKICLNKITMTGAEMLACEDISIDNPVDLKVVSKGIGYHFSYRDGKKDWKTLISDVDARYLSTENASGFTGTTIGLYATKNNHVTTKLSLNN